MLKVFERLLVLLPFISPRDAINSNPRCRNVPGDAGFPSTSQWAALNASLTGRLARVVPTAEFCQSQPGGVCTIQQFTSAVFMSDVPGAMNAHNWEQDYDSHPPSLCTIETPVCGQGDVPLFGVLAESVKDVQVGIKFATLHNLRLAVKSTGHDLLGRSTAKNSLLISTHKFKNISFTDNFVIGGQNKGSVVTLGSGVFVKDMYQATKAQGKIAVGGTLAASVAVAGGYVQGGGHSVLSPLLGLGADNCVELNVVLANGDFVKANEVQNSDLFWAMRGGGAGSWGIIVSATFRTFSTFDIVVSTISISTDSISAMAEVATIHAKHIFDWDALHAGQSFSLSAVNPGNNENLTMVILTYFPKASTEQASTALKPFITDLLSIGGVSLQQSMVQSSVNDALFQADDMIGGNSVLGSRFVPTTAYRNDPEKAGEVYSQLLQGGTSNIIGVLAGGKIAENENLNAINPAWRAAKTHMIIANIWADSATIPEVLANETLFMREQLPVLEKIAGTNSGAYSNEADVLEQNFQYTFFGSNYPRLREIKSKYDPDGLFIVRAGVGSEEWDSKGICRV